MEPSWRSQRENAATVTRRSTPEGLRENIPDSVVSGVEAQGEEYGSNVDRDGEAQLDRSGRRSSQSDTELTIDDTSPVRELDDQAWDYSMPASSDYAHSAIAQEQVEDDSDERIYVLGVGAVGTFIAHSLRGLTDAPPITLLLHGRRNVYAFESKDCALQVTTHGRIERLTGFDYERLEDRRMELPAQSTSPKDGQEESEYTFDYQEEGQNDARPERRSEPQITASETQGEPKPIRNIIVTTKALHTVKALNSVAHRLSADSTICFMQNGMGVIDELNEKVFTDPTTRPRYLIGIVSHGLYQDGSFQVEHRGHGTIALSVQAPSLTIDLGDTKSLALWNLSSRYMMRTLTRTSVLCALGLHPVDLLYMQLEKLAANCVINPLTVIFNCRNGDLGLNPGFRAMMRLIIAEISLVFRKLPELKPLGQDKIDRKFSAKRIEFMVQRIMKTTSPNLSSMWQDVFGKRADARMTEIDYLNGYIVRRGEGMGIKCIVNYMMTQQVEAQRVLQQRKRAGLEPFEKFSELDQVSRSTIRDAEETRRGVGILGQSEKDVAT